MFNSPISRCDVQDVPALARMLRGTPLPSGGQHWPAEPGGEAGRRAYVAALLDAGVQLLAYHAEAVPRGYLMWRWGEAGRRARLEHIWVEPSWRRRGVGRRLIAAFEAEIAGQGAIGWESPLTEGSAPTGALMARAGARRSAAGLGKGFQKPV